jgi:hypothetical protein
MEPGQLTWVCMHHPVTALVANFEGSDCLNQPGTEGALPKQLGRGSGRAIPDKEEILGSK